MLDKINQDLKTAMLASDIAKVSVLRMVKSELQNQTIANKGTLTDDDIVMVMTREVKKRKEAAEAFKNVGNELHEQTELAEAEIIQAYLPEQLSREEIEKVVLETIQEVDEANVGRIMGAVMAKLKGKADGNVVSEIVREKFSQ